MLAKAEIATKKRHSDEARIRDPPSSYENHGPEKQSPRIRVPIPDI